jgi:hypothetical protein
MVQTVYLYRVRAPEPEYVGKVELESSLQLGRLNWYFHQRQRQVIRVDRIEPADWIAGTETIPTIYGSNPELAQRVPPPRGGVPELEPRRRIAPRLRR